jgi:isopenicillin N synthase-like dioxygenase
MSVPIVDVEPLVTGAGDARPVAAAIDAACRDTGFFAIVGHGVGHELRERLERAARSFFALDEREKSLIAMARGGRAWRGWFPLDGELTSGVPDHKEGIYFGAEIAADDARVVAGVPLHGPNLFPVRPPELRDAVLEYLATMTVLGHGLMRGIALSLSLDADWFERELTGDPTILFRIFHYPPTRDGWGVAEHTDYGLLTILGQDGTGGLEVRARDGWVTVPPDPGTFICNIGDMLERMTGGRYRSTPHRVRNRSDVSRLSFPFFFDPGWNTEVRAIVPPAADAESGPPRWDGANVHALSGTYGEYLVTKVSKVFPALSSDALRHEARDGNV